MERRMESSPMTPSGLSLREGPPDQKVASFSCSCSLAGSPVIMAARRPLPMGRASFQTVAGLGYHKVVAPLGMDGSTSTRIAEPLLADTGALNMADNKPIQMMVFIFIVRRFVHGNLVCKNSRICGTKLLTMIDRLLIWITMAYLSSNQ